MKIISGEKKGRKIFGPGPEAVRPMRQLVRKALFDILRNVVPESDFLDLFSGTGGVGLEALSRGANRAAFVDNLHESIRMIGKNIEKLGYQDKTTVYEMDVKNALEKFKLRDRRYDLVFLGPPYGEGLTVKTLQKFKGTNIVSDWGIIAGEVFFKNDLPEKFGKIELIDSREYGQSRLVIYRKKPE